jgi:hypothetical protein
VYLLTFQVQEAKSPVKNTVSIDGGPGRPHSRYGRLGKGKIKEKSFPVKKALFPYMKIRSEFEGQTSSIPV